MNCRPFNFKLHRITSLVRLAVPRFDCTTPIKLRLLDARFGAKSDAVLKVGWVTQAKRYRLTDHMDSGRASQLFDGHRNLSIIHIFGRHLLVAAVVPMRI